MSFPNLYVAGDWVVNRHGSWSQVSKSLVIKSTISFSFLLPRFRVSSKIILFIGEMLCEWG